MAGRPRQFDRDQALDRAVQLFWRQGYEATGMSQLSDHMGIGKQSLYDTFGDKRSIFLEALKRYSDESIGWLRTTLSMNGSALRNIHLVLDTWVNNLKNKDFCGCFMANSVVEFGVRDQEIAQILKANLQRMSRAFEAALVVARNQGTVSPDTDSRSMARFIVNAGQGLAVLGKVDPVYAKAVANNFKEILK